MDSEGIEAVDVEHLFWKFSSGRENINRQIVKRGSKINEGCPQDLENLEKEPSSKGNRYVRCQIWLQAQNEKKSALFIEEEI